MNLFKSLYIHIVLLVCSSFQVLASTDVISLNKALTAFQLAIEDSNIRLHQYRKLKQAISFKQTSEDKNGKILQQEFIPQKIKQGNVEGKWNTLREDAGFNQSINIADNLLFETTNIDIDNVQLVAETNSTWVFRLPNAVNIESEGDDGISNQDIMKLNDTIANYLLTEIIIDKENPKIKALKIFATEEFNPSFMVTIEKFELRLDFSEAWPNGPIIRKNMSKHIKGDLSWVIEINEIITTELSDIRKIDLSDVDSLI